MVLLLGYLLLCLMKEKNFENYLEKNNNLSRATLSLRIYGCKLINEYVDLESKIIEFKKLDDPGCTCGNHELSDEESG